MSAAILAQLFFSPPLSGRERCVGHAGTMEDSEDFDEDPFSAAGFLGAAAREPITSEPIALQDAKFMGGTMVPCHRVLGGGCPTGAAQILVEQRVLQQYIGITDLVKKRKSEKAGRFISCAGISISANTTTRFPTIMAGTAQT